MAEPTADNSRPWEVLNPHPEGTPEFYDFEIRRLERELASRGEARRDALAIQRDLDTWKKIMESKGIDLATYHLSKLDPLRRLLSQPDLLAHNEQQLRELKEAMDAADDLGARELDVKKKVDGADRPDA